MQSVRDFVRNHSLVFVFAVGIVLAIAAFSFISPAGLQRPGTYPEVVELKQTNWSFQQYSTYFQQLSETKGAVYAYDVLKQSQLPPGIDYHLLGHVVGDMLYKQNGIAGIKYCTEDFRDACSHSVVIGILRDHGIGALPQIVAACKEAPGGRGAYTMCFHGLGHGVLAYNEYDLKKAIPMCKMMGTPEYQNREYIECVGGTIMEMIAGVHDPIAWKQQVGKYFKDSDPLYPCDADWMPEEARSVCYVQLTPHLFTAAGGDLGNLQPPIYEKAFSFCDVLPKDSQVRKDCYGGFGKEFIGIAQGRDIRDVGSMPEVKLRDIHAWCALAHDAHGQWDCISSTLASLFWGGEATPDASFTFCRLASSEYQSSCYLQLADHIGYYLGGTSRGTQLCQRLPEPARGGCTAPKP
jgi:hypothetical protein